MGRTVAASLGRAGHPLRCTVRNLARAAHLADAGHELVECDLSDRRALEAAVCGMDAVVHVAGLVRALSRAEMWQVNVAGTRRLASACGAADVPPTRFLLVSSQAAGGPAGLERAVTEADPASPISDYGRSKLAGERAARTALPPSTALTVVRPPAVFGPHDTDIFEFFKLASQGVRVRLGTRARHVSAVHSEDLAEGIRLALESERAAGATYYIADPEPCALDDLLADIARAVGAPKRISARVPDPVVRLAGALVEEIARVRGVLPDFSRDKAVEFLARGWVCDSSRAREELGWSPARPLPERVAETAAWYVEQGWLPAQRSASARAG